MKALKAITLMIALFSIFSIGGCSSKKAATQQKSTAMNSTEVNPTQMPIGIGGKNIQQLAPIVIYKTQNDYNQMVPVALGADGTIENYPSRLDLGSAGNFLYPVELENGYLWDRRGVGQNTAFLSLSYEEYAALPNDPTAAELQDFIMDKSPFTFLAVCDRSQLKEVSQAGLNQYISEGMPGARILINR